MKFRREKRQHAEVNAGSLSDILFFLLLFFLIVSTLASATAIKLRLPNSSEGKSIPKNPIMLSVDADFNYAIGTDVVPYEGLKDALALEDAGEGRSVVLRVDKTVPVQYMIDAMDIVNQLGLPIVVATDKKKE